MARVAWIKGYLYGKGESNIALARARKRSLEMIRNRRVAQVAQGSTGDQEGARLTPTAEGA